LNRPPPALVAHEKLVAHKKTAIAVDDDLLTRFGNDTDPEIRVLVARALYNKGGGRYSIFGDDRVMDKVIAAYNDLLTRFGNDTDPEIRMLVAETLKKKESTLSYYPHYRYRDRFT
jgi:hypothetical protein